MPIHAQVLVSALSVSTDSLDEETAGGGHRAAALSAFIALLASPSAAVPAAATAVEILRCGGAEALVRALGLFPNARKLQVGPDEERSCNPAVAYRHC